MKNRPGLVYLVSGLIMLSLISCSHKKQETGKENTDSKNSAREIKVIRSFENVSGAAKTQISAFLVDYLALNQMLIADDQEGANAAARKMLETVNKFEIASLTADQMDFYLMHVSVLRQSLKEIGENADIEKTRLSLATVSESMYVIVKAYHPNASTLYYQYCPMARDGKGANWLSDTREIVNPYMGQMMPECGRTEETLP